MLFFVESGAGFFCCFCVVLAFVFFVGLFFFDALVFCCLFCSSFVLWRWRGVFMFFLSFFVFVYNILVSSLEEWS